MKLPANSIIAAGPVIIEDGRVLLNRERKDGRIMPWMFPGGEVENFDATLADACRREVKEEMGIDIEILKPLEPVILHQAGRVAVLIHYLAKRMGDVKPAANIAEWGWHYTANLPDNCAPNVYEVLRDLPK